MFQVGPLLIAAFVLSQALRDVYLAQVFRGVDVFALILATFPLMARLFGALAGIIAYLVFMCAAGLAHGAGARKKPG
jgi:hypothetical protein